MKPISKEIHQRIKQLLQINKDAAMGYRKAAEHAIDASLQAHFGKISSERKSFNIQLIAQIKTAYTHFDIQETIPGILHNFWIDFLGLVSPLSDEKLVEETLKCDVEAKNKYIELLNDNALPEDLRKLLEEQSIKIENTLKMKGITKISNSSYR